MDTKQLEEMADKLQNESYNLTKSISALLYRVMPADTDAENDYTMSLVSVLVNQSRLVTEMATELSMNISHIDKNSKETDKHSASMNINFDSIKDNSDSKSLVIGDIESNIEKLNSLSEEKLMNLDFDDSDIFADKLDSLIRNIDESLEYLIYNLLEQDKIKLLERAKQGKIPLIDILNQEYYIDDENFSDIYDSPIDKKADIINTLLDNIKLNSMLIRNIDELKIINEDDKIYIYQSLLNTGLTLSRYLDEFEITINDLNHLLGYKNLEK